jgi:hypothetical protein
MATKDIDTTVAHSARVYDYWLGGKDNFAADRAAAEEVLRARPAIRLNVRANRAFLGRSVRYLSGEAGIGQFLDIGTGIPSAYNVHEVAQSVTPEARVVHVDNDRCKSGCTHHRPTQMYDSYLGGRSRDLLVAAAYRRYTCSVLRISLARVASAAAMNLWRLLIALVMLASESSR